MAQAPTANKSMTFGEGGTAAAFVVLALTCLIVTANAHTSEYAFHAFLFVIGSVTAVFAIFNRYFDRAAEPAPLDDRRQAELQHGPGQVRDGRGGDLGHRGFHGRHHARRCNSPSRPSTSICRGSRSAASGRCTPRR